MEDNYDNINYYFITKNKLLYFDVFARNNKIIMVMPKYNDYNIEYDKVAINLHP